MKTKTIKNINALLLILLLCMTASAGAFLILEDRKLGLLGPGLISGKADAVLGFGSEQDEETQAEIEINNEKPISGPATNAEQASSSQLNAKAEDKSGQVGESKERAKFSFVAMGDADSKDETSGFSSRLEHALSKAKSHAPDLVLFTGDILRIGSEGGKQSESRVEGLKDLIQKYHNNYYLVFGNHDIECGDECIGFWRKIFFGQEDKQEKHKLYHSFDYQNTHFVLLSTDYPQRYGIDDGQLEWLRKDLEGNKQENTIIVQHVSPIPFFKDSEKKCHDMTCNEARRQELLKIYKEHKVDLVVSGNENAFDHQIVEGIDFVLSGSIGNEAEHKGAIKDDIYVLCSVNGQEISLKGINTKGKTIREIKIK